MQRSLRASLPAFGFASLLLSSLTLIGCSQLVDFDRSKIPADDAGGGSTGGGNQGDGGMKDAGSQMDAGKPGMDAGKPGMDAGMDANMSMPDAGSDAGGGGCDPATHAGCAADQLCCDTDSNGSFECVATSPGQCESCGVACDANVADDCTDRTCGCGAGSKVECSGSLPFCDADLDACVVCRDSTDCSSDTANPFCFLPGGSPSALDNTCVECDPTTNAGCGGTTPLCSATGVCEACTVSAKSCEGSLVCLSNGACQCSVSTDCVTPTTPICGTDSICVGCASDAECDAERSEDQCTQDRCGPCDLDSEEGCDTLDAADCRVNGLNEPECLGCQDNAACTRFSTTKICDTTGGVCVGCVLDSDCTVAGKPLCDVDTNTCVACDAASVATDPGANPDDRCAAKTGPNDVTCAKSGSKKGQCAACDPGRQSTCSNNQLCCEVSGVPGCEVASAGTQCETCDTACNLESANLCTAHECRCGTNPECSGTNHICDGTACVECDDNSDCREVGDDASQTFCNGANTCVECLDSGDCTTAGAPICNGSGVCVACTNDGQCSAKGGVNDYCSTSGANSGHCGTCDPTDSAECTNAAAPVCNPSSLTCGTCTNDAQCSAKGGVNDYCASSGANTGHCGTCDPIDSAECTTAAAPVCNATTLTCGACTTDGQCAAKGGPNDICSTSGANSGHCGTCDPTDSAECTTATTPICDETALTCKACNASGIPATACDDKPGALAECVSGGAVSGAPVGACAVCDPQSDSGCTGTSDQCKAGATPSCVDCDATGGCGANQVCKTTSNSCVECLGDSDCSDTASTPACDVGTNSCVECTDNSDCSTGNLACISQTCQACSSDAECVGHPTGTQCANTGAGFECRACDPKTLGDTGDDEGCTGGDHCDETTFVCVP